LTDLGWRQVTGRVWVDNRVASAEVAASPPGRVSHGAAASRGNKTDQLVVEQQARACCFFDDRGIRR
jgi:hypothetical protein